MKNNIKINSNNTASSPFDPYHPVNSRALTSRDSHIGVEQAEAKHISYWRRKSFALEKQDNVSVELGLKESAQNQVTKKEDDRKKLAHMVANSNRLLIGTKSVFPFDFFPNTINVEATRVNIIRRSLFYSQVHSVDIKDISNIFISQSLFFATLVIVSATFAKNEIKIGHLWKGHAVEVRRIVEGLRMIVKADIDMDDYSVEELNDKLRELSTTEIVL